MSKLKKVQIEEISLVKKGANKDAKVALFKSVNMEELTKNIMVEKIKAKDMAENAAEELHSVLWSAKDFLVKDLHSAQNKEEVDSKISEFCEALSTLVADKALSLNLIKAAGKTENGTVFPASDYAYVPDEEKPSTWKLRLTETPGGEPTVRMVGMCIAALGEGFRGNKVELPDDMRPKVIAHIKSAWTKLHPKEKNVPEVLKSTEDNKMSKELLEKITKLENDIALEKAQKEEALWKSELTDEEKIFYKSLNDDAKKAFQKLDADGRKAEMLKHKQSDEVFEMEGQVIRKSAIGNDMFLALKKQHERMVKAEEQANKEREERLAKELQDKAQNTFPHLAGTPAEKAALLKVAGENEAILECLKSADKAMEAFQKTLGVKGEEDNDALGKLNKMAKSLATEKKITFEQAFDQVITSKEGSDLYMEV